MIATRFALRSGPILVGALWAGVLVVLGLRLLAHQGAGAAPAGAWFWAGLFLLASGQFVFMVIVADRIITPRRPALAFAAEGVTVLATVVSIIALAAVLAGSRIA